MKHMLYYYKVRGIHSVYDGDTARLEISVGFYMVTTSVAVRLNGINALELGQPRAIEGRDFLRALLEKGIAEDNLTIRTFKTEKYGRWLCDLYLGMVHINQEMITKGYAVPYMV